MRMICWDEGVGKEWILKHFFFQNFEMNPFMEFFFRDTFAYCISSHSDIINNYVTKRQSHFFVVPVSVFLFFFVLFLVAMQFLMAFFKFSFLI